MNEDFYLNLIAKYFSNNTTENEKSSLFEWVNASAENRQLFEEMEKLWTVADHYDDPFESPTTTEEAWGRLAGSIIEEESENRGTEEPKKNVGVNNHSLELTKNETPKTKNQTRIRRLQWFSAAAMLLLCLGTWAVWVNNPSSIETNNQLVEYKTGMEGIKSIILPDNSKVWLNKNSQINFQQPFETRIVQLIGEAFFDVQHNADSPFIVQTDQYLTRVLGTTFNVRAYPEEADIEVSVETGKVQVSNKQTSTKTAAIVLAAGNKTVIHKDGAHSEQLVDKHQNASSWKTNQLVFAQSPLPQVIGALENHFQVDIKTANPALLNCHFTGTFKKPQLNQIFDVLTFGGNIQLKQNKTTYILSGKGCEK